MATENVFIKFIPDASEVEDKVTELSEEEKKAFTAGNAELAKRLKLLEDGQKQQKAAAAATQQQLDLLSKQLAQQKQVTSETQKQVTETQKAAAETQKQVQVEKQVTLEQQKQVKETTSQAAETAKHVTALGKELQVQKSIQEAFEKQFVSAKTVGDQIIALGNIFDAAFKTGGAENVQAVFDAIQAEIAETGLTVDQFVEQLKGIDPATELVTQSTVNLEEELSRTRNAMGSLIVAGKENSKEYQELAKKAIELQRAQNSVNVAVQDGVKGNSVLIATSQAVDALNASFQVAIGATQLFGANSEDLMKSIQLLNGVMVVSNGLQQVTTILKDRDNIVNKALIATQNLLTASIFGTSAALTTMQKALLNTGIGVLVVALGVAITKLVSFISHMHDATAAVNNLNLVLNKIGDNADKRAEAIQHEGQLQAENAKRTTDAFNNVYAANKKMTDALIVNEQKRQAAFEITAKRLQDSNDELYKSFNGNDAERLKVIKQYQDAAVDANEKKNALLQQHELAASQHETERYQKSVEEAKTAADKRVQIAANEQAAKREIEDRTTDYIIEKENEVTNNENENYRTRLSALENSHKLRQKQIETQRQRELTDAKKNADVTAAELLNIEDKYNVEREKADSEYFKTKDQLTKASLKAQAELELANQQNIIKEQLLYVEKSGRDELELHNNLLKLQAEQQRKQVEESIADEQLRAAKIKEIDLELNARLAANYDQFYKERLRKQSELRKQQNDVTITTITESVIGKNSDSNAVYEAEQKKREVILKETLDNLKDLEDAYNKGEIKDLEQYNKDKNDLELEASNKRIEILQAEADRRKKINDTIRDAAFDIAGQLSDAVFEISDQKRQAQLDKQTDQLNTARQNELDNANLTEQQKEQINERYDAKERQLKRRAAEQDKQAAISQASINAALAITKAFATLAWPFNLIQAAATAAATGIQIAKIKSTPLPAYAKGTRNAKRGSAIVGEEGAEIKYMQGGEIVLTHKETMQVLKYATTREMVNATVNTTVERTINNKFKSFKERELSTVIENVVNRQFVNNAAGAAEVHTTNVHNQNVSVGGAPINYKKMASEIGTQFKKHGLKVETNFNQNGMEQFIHKAGIKTQYLNSRYKL